MGEALITQRDRSRDDGDCPGGRAQAPSQQGAGLSRVSWRYAAATKDLTLVHSDWIWVSGEPGALCREALAERRIVCVLNCCDRVKCPFAKRMPAYYVARGFRDTKQTLLRDHVAPMHDLLDCFHKKRDEWWATPQTATRGANGSEDGVRNSQETQSNKPGSDTRVATQCPAVPPAVLVHCSTGASRSTSTVLSWLVTRGILDFDDAYAQLKCKRPLTRPNASFMQQLRELERLT
ncbi:Dual specificity protein phosphatase 1 [Diplonema papillatum]|nr:Dual specificity protein phosphatase 1 [Diplonema papillatum]